MEHKPTTHPNPQRPAVKPRKAKLPMIRWADFDPSYRGNVAFQVHDTLKDQRGIRPDLEPFQVLILDFSEAGKEWLAEEFRRAIDRLHHGAPGYDTPVARMNRKLDAITCVAALSRSAGQKRRGRK